VSDALLCTGCLDQLRVELRAVPWLVEQLTITLTRQARVGRRVGPRPTERAMPYHHGASVDLEALRDSLHVWCHTIATTRGISVDAEHDAVDLSRWLLRWAGEAAQHPNVGVLHGDILALTRAARRTIDLAPELRFVGPCDGHGATHTPSDPGGCGQDLYVTAFSRHAACSTDGCHAAYPIEARRVWLLEQAEDQLMTPVELSRLLLWIAGLTVTRQTITLWGARGAVTQYLPHARDPRATLRYRVGEIMDKAEVLTAQRLARHAHGAA